MTYEKALELKKLGYPQERKSGFVMHIDDFDSSQDVYSPTLSELIAACGDKFGTTFQGFSGNWFAWRKDQKTTDKTCSGKTPEIAVANLWLELNKK